VVKILIKCSVFLVFILLINSGCSSSDELATPEVIGSKIRSKVISGAEAFEAINKLHGLAVAADKNTIAEYGTEENRDLLYISSYGNADTAYHSFKKMMEKMAHSKDGPFFHLMPLPPNKDKLFFTLGLGAAHYVFVSRNYIIWYQTYQSTGMDLPQSLTDLYPLEQSAVIDED